MPNPDPQSPENILTPEQLEALRQQLKALTFPKPRQKSFLELIDLHRLESVSSKILSHFLDSQADHGLGNLPLIALMQAAGIKSRRKPETQQVYVELPCKLRADGRKGRLDLVLELTDQLIVIENKIHHKVNNPFDLYIKFCQTKRFKDIEKQTYVLMGLNQPSPMPEGFVFVSHYEFGNILRQLIKQHGDEQPNGHRYSAFLMDYLEGIDSMNPKKFTAQHQHIVEFVQDHGDLLNQLQAQQKMLSDYTKQQLVEAVEYLEHAAFGEDKIYPHQAKDAVWSSIGHYFYSNTIRIKGLSYYCFLVAQWYLSDVYITVEMRKPRGVDQWISTTEVDEALKSLGIKPVKNDEHLTILYKKPAKGMTPERFAKEIDKQYQRLIHAGQ
ncbi:MAG: PD-(D/E)XK nuclease family protein [Pseudomonadota bacterium]|nr:PD-(D/E)XK nuclease family protein [Pseudomonadota bacterium]